MASGFIPKAQQREQQERNLAKFCGEEGGFLTWESSPLCMWLCRRVGAAPVAGGGA